MQTGDRILQWNRDANGVCVLCHDALETRDHLFFGCCYSGRVWKELVGSIMGDGFSTEWSDIIEAISVPRGPSTESFLIRYTFQVLAHSIWRERNERKHGESPKDERTLVKIVDKMVRLKLLLVKGKGKRYLEGSLLKWLETRD